MRLSKLHTNTLLVGFTLSRNLNEGDHTNTQRKTRASRVVVPRVVKIYKFVMEILQTAKQQHFAIYRSRNALITNIYILNIYTHIN